MPGRKQDGQSMVEFALLAPLLFLLILGIVDFGRAVYFYNSIDHGAREAARYAVALSSVGATDVTIRQQARLDLFSVAVDQSTCGTPGSLCATPPSSSATPNLAYVAVSPTNDQRVGNQSQAAQAGQTTRYPLTVTLTYYFQPVTPIIGQLIGNSIKLVGQTTMLTEY